MISELERLVKAEAFDAIPEAAPRCQSLPELSAALTALRAKRAHYARQLLELNGARAYTSHGYNTDAPTLNLEG